MLFIGLAFYAPNMFFPSMLPFRVHVCAMIYNYMHRLAKYDDSVQTSPLLTSRLPHQSSSSNVFSRLTTNASASDDNSRYVSSVIIPCIVVSKICKSSHNYEYYAKIAGKHN